MWVFFCADLHAPRCCFFFVFLLFLFFFFSFFFCFFFAIYAKGTTLLIFLDDKTLLK